MTTTDTKTKAPVEEMRAAAKALRAGKRFVDSEVRTYDRDYLAWLSSLVATAVPLAEWLEVAADDYTTIVSDAECPNCAEASACQHQHQDEFCVDCDEPVSECQCLRRPLAVARAINGDAR